jgi:hypothetical protein
MLDDLFNNIYAVSFFWAMFVAVLMRYWKSENSGDRLIYEALTAIAMLLTVLVVIGFSITLKIQ